MAIKNRGKGEGWLFWGMEAAKYFEDLADFRVKGWCLLELSDIVLRVGFMADCENFEEVEDFGKDKKAYLQQFLKVSNGIPSHDTMNRCSVIWRQWHWKFVSGSGEKAILAELDYKHLMVDCKEKRGTCSSANKHALNQLVSVWVSEGQLTSR